MGGQRRALRADEGPLLGTLKGHRTARIEGWRERSTLSLCLSERLLLDRVEFGLADGPGVEQRLRSFDLRRGTT